MTNQKVLEAFQLMWGNFPEPVMLVHKFRDILAVNEARGKNGVIPGTKCSSIGNPNQHKGCLANQALATQKAICVKENTNNNPIIAYWLPIPNYPEIYVHFAISTTIKCD